MVKQSQGLKLQWLGSNSWEDFILPSIGFQLVNCVGAVAYELDWYFLGKDHSEYLPSTLIICGGLVSQTSELHWMFKKNIWTIIRSRSVSSYISLIWFSISKNMTERLHWLHFAVASWVNKLFNHGLWSLDGEFSGRKSTSQNSIYFMITSHSSKLQRL